MRKFFLAYFFVGCVTCFVSGQPIIDDLPQITGCIALVNAKVVSKPGKAPQVSTIVLRDGLITAIGPDIKIPADAYRVAADSLYAYPAFIDAFSSIGLKEQEEATSTQGAGNRAQRPPVDAEGNPSLEDAGITPFQKVRSSFDAKSKSIADWRAQGFAVAHVVPKGKMIPGQGALLILSGKNTDQVLWKEDVSMFAQWTGASGNYPNTIIAIVAKWRELYHNATQSVQHQTAYANSSLVSRPMYNQAHEALAPVVKKEMPLFFRAPGVKDISRAIELQKDLGMKMVIADAEQSWYLKEQFKTGTYPLVLSLKLAEDKGEKNEEKTEGKTDSATVADSTKTVAPDPEKEMFERKRAESLAAHHAQAAVMAREGIPFSFGTLSAKSGDFTKNIQLMIDKGLTTDQALAAFTTHPAKLLGIEKNCGTLEVGKMANIMVSNKPVFEKEAAIRYMIVEGNLYEYEVKEKKKKTEKVSDADTDVLTGTWSYAIETPDQKREGTMEFTNEDGEIIGTIKGKDFTSGNDELEDIVLDGNSVGFTFNFELEGTAMTLEFDLTLKGEAFEGNVSVGEFGTFTIHGQRITKPQ